MLLMPLTLVANSRWGSPSPGLGRMETPAKSIPGVPEASVEFATGVNRRVTRGHLETYWGEAPAMALVLSSGISVGRSVELGYQVGGGGDETMPEVRLVRARVGRTPGEGQSQLVHSI